MNTVPGRCWSNSSQSGCVTEDQGALTAVNLIIPVDKSEGMETALLDHFRALADVLAHRVTAGANPSKLTGGSTFSFKMDREHPLFDEVTSLLARTRSDAQELWERVMSHNETRRRHRRSEDHLLRGSVHD